MVILHDDPLCTLHLGDCVEVMRELPADSVDAIVTDPPYGLEFMGRSWDKIGAAIPGRDDLRANLKGERVAGGEFGERIGIAYGTPHKNPRCRKCYRLKHDHEKGRCKCAEPDWDLRKSEYGYAMQWWHEAWAREAFRVAKPGAHLLAFGGTRTYHRLASAIEDAGWEIRDCLVWAYASGFPKSLDVSKAIDKAAGAEREVVGIAKGPGTGAGLLEQRASSFLPGEVPVTAPATPAAEKWNGWGTALKPAWEPIVMARKPLRGTVAANVLAFGTGAINIRATRIVAGPTATMDAWESDGYLCDSCAVDAGSQGRSGAPATRVSTTPKPAELSPSEPGMFGATSASPGTSASTGTTPEPTDTSSSTARSGRTRTARSQTATSSTTSTGTRPTTGSRTCRSCGATSTVTTTIDGTTSTPSDPLRPTTNGDTDLGRWPSNVMLGDPIFDGDTPGVVGGGAQESTSIPGAWQPRGAFPIDNPEPTIYGDSGTYSRFFLIPKSSRSDREPLVRGVLEERDRRTRSGGEFAQLDERAGANRNGSVRANSHPTVKPLDLMRHLVRLVTPPGGTVLDPFLGSGTTAIAANAEGFRCIGIEKEREYLDITLARMTHQPLGLGLDVAAPTRKRTTFGQQGPDKPRDKPDSWQHSAHVAEGRE